jgi:hypothetical protein
LYNGQTDEYKKRSKLRIGNEYSRHRSGILKPVGKLTLNIEPIFLSLKSYLQDIEAAIGLEQSSAGSSTLELNIMAFPNGSMDGLTLTFLGCGRLRVPLTQHN